MAKRKVKRCRTRKRGRRASKFNGTLLRLKKLNPSQRHQAMAIANDKFIRDFSSQVKKLRWSHGLRKKLVKHRKALRKLTNKKTSIKAKRKMLSQRGGFLPLLLAALPAIGSIAGGIISRA